MYNLKNKTLPFLVLLSALYGIGCFSYSNFLSSEQNMLKRVALSNDDGTNKIDSLLASSVRMMEVALKPINPVKGGKLVGKYYNQNQGAMQQIMSEVNTDFAKLNLGQQATFGINLAKRPYTKDFIKLYPKFRRKYKTVKTASKFLGFMGKSIGGNGKLGFLLGN